MKDAIARLKMLLQDEYEVAGYRLHTLTAERLSECMSLLEAIEKPLVEVRDEGELIDCCMEAGHLHYLNINDDDCSDETVIRIKNIRKGALKTIGVE